MRRSPSRSSACSGCRCQSMHESIYITAEHEALRDQVRALRRPTRSSRMPPPGKSRAACRARCCAAWAGLGLLGLMYAERVRRRRRRRAHQPGVRRGAVAVDLRRLHRHGAGAHRHGRPHLHHAGTPEQLARYLPRVISGRADHRGRHHRARRGVGRRGHPHPRAARRRRLGAQRHQDVHHQRRARRPVLRRGQDRRGGERATSRCSSSRRARRASASGAR